MMIQLRICFMDKFNGFFKGYKVFISHSSSLIPKLLATSYYLLIPLLYICVFFLNHGLLHLLLSRFQKI